MTNIQSAVEAQRVTRTERGWGGHFICASRCGFRRNTLLECGEVRIVVSTVGAMQKWEGDPRQDKNITGTETIGAFGRVYETMAFHASLQGPYWDANVSRHVRFESEWAIVEPIVEDSDQKANDMHEAVVKELTEKMAAGFSQESELA